LTDHPKFARADHDILDLIRQRWSPRAFDPQRQVDDADLRRLFEAARWSPSSGNEQPWRFVVTSRSATPDAYTALLASTTPKNQSWAGEAPVLILVAVRLTTERTDTVNSHAWYDTGQAVSFLTLQATSLGLSVRQMQGFSPAAARAACAVPAPYEAAVVMAVGYAGDPERLAIDAHKAAELQPRQRRPVNEFVFVGTWGERLA